MANTGNTNNTQDVSGLIASADPIVAFKEQLNKDIPTLFPETASWGTLMHPTPDPLDISFITILNQFVLSNSQSTNTGVQSLLKQYNSLPEIVKAPIDLHNSLFIAPNGNNDAPAQAQAVINLAQSTLGTEETHNGTIDKTTARALRERLKTLQTENPDIKVDFDPINNDIRSARFLNALLEKRMSAAGVDAADLNETVTQLWFLQQNHADGTAPAAQRAIGEAAALLNLTKLAVYGALPSGASTTKPQMEAPWDQHWSDEAAPDRFFSNATYKALLNSESVPGAVLFLNTTQNPNAALLKQMADHIGLDTNKPVYTKNEVGLLAIEMLSHQAHQLCIEDKDVNQAIHNREFMPHIDDLYLVNSGFGEGSRVDISPEAKTKYFEAQTQFAHRFGALPPEAIENGMTLFKADFVESMTDQDKREYIASRYTSPAHFFFLPYHHTLGSDEPVHYNTERTKTYLPKLAERMGDGALGGNCIIDQYDTKPSNGDCTVEDATIDGGCGVKKSLPPMIKQDTECTVESSTMYGPCSKDFSKTTTSNGEIPIAINANDTGCTVEEAQNYMPCGITHQPSSIIGRPQ